MAQQRVLIVDDEEGVRTSLGLILEDEGYAVRTAGEADRALELVSAGTFDVILCDVRMPGRDGLDLLPDLVRLQPQATVLMMSAFGEVEQALEAVRRGAYDFLSKPFQAEELLLVIRKAEERERLARENARLRHEIRDGRGARTLVAASEPMKQICELVERAAEYKTTVLVTGQSGVGKEVVARTIHELSGRAAGPFIAVNCGAIPETLMESELFGHARGAFTGADVEKRGLFREADGGTLFLDEVGELPKAVQVKLLRVLQEEEVRPVGEPKAVSVDVRILAATARDLQAEVASGRFRDDLFYRLDVMRIHLPPLRDRAEDLPVLADQILQGLCRRIGKQVGPLSDVVLAALQTYDWPGNVRELENTLERALILAPPTGIEPEHLPFTARAAHAASEASGVSASRPAGDEDLSIKRGTRALEERLIRLALESTGGNRTRAARILEISPRALQYKIKEYAVEPLNPLPPAADTD
ncbi:MAG: sigma-54-dependent Fis family transcriptional regulator [Deltaproteobacteria bacterium]|nr:sigma-54-dependent Fis family transcriptional regulator [Deltaproteobacteria bacterium]MBW2416220.1 sigma-54-dependent Fis family transcriptional regulator [Deltaproteobacteria bacterium]